MMTRKRRRRLLLKEIRAKSFITIFSIKKLIFLLPFVLISSSLSVQTPEELNLQSKEALDKQDYKAG
ncbi:MAG TPA: hypothetical protein VNW49_05840 [Puia sp.]|nr:hypothetical protein [Puia sp.]